MVVGGGCESANGARKWKRGESGQKGGRRESEGWPGLPLLLLLLIAQPRHVRPIRKVAERRGKRKKEKGRDGGRTDGRKEKDETAAISFLRPTLSTHVFLPLLLPFRRGA